MQTRIDAYPMLRVDDILDQVGQARYMSGKEILAGTSSC